MFDCDQCTHRDACEIRDAILQIEEDYGVKLQIGYCPDYRAAEPTEAQLDLLELFPDDGLDPDDFSVEDLA